MSLAWLPCKPPPHPSHQNEGPILATNYAVNYSTLHADHVMPFLVRGASLHVMNPRRSLPTCTHYMRQPGAAQHTHNMPATTTHSGMLYDIMCQSQNYREQTHEGYACVEHSMAEGIKQRAGHCHKGYAIAYGLEVPYTNPTTITRPTGKYDVMPVHEA
eukprot:358804-Chlamydomonas_euryale.AAC.1